MKYVIKYDEIKSLLMKKVEQELFNYKQNLIKNKTPEEIIENAYQINIKEQIKDIMGDFIFSKEQMQILLKTDNILDKLYYKYEHSDGNIWGQLEDNVSEKIGEIFKEYNQDKNKDKDEVIKEKNKKERER